MSSPQRLEELRADARYHRERLDVYRAKMYGPRPTSATRFRELERAHEAAQSRLNQAEHVVKQVEVPVPPK